MNRVAVLLVALFCFADADAANVFPCFSCAAPLTDTIPPVIHCPPNDVIALGPGECATGYSFVVNYSDNLPGVTLVQTAGLHIGDAFPIGVTTNVFRATDAAGNTRTCSFTVTVQNYSVPLVCETLTNVALDQNCTAQPLAGYYLFGGDSYYGCTDSFKVEVDRVPPFGNGPWQPGVYDAADINKTYMARITDVYTGNKCWGNIKVIDNLAPLVVCETLDISCAVPSVAPAFLHDSLGIAIAKPQAMDNCGGPVNLSFIDATFTLGCDTIYQEVIQRRWTARDEYFNTSSCVQQIRLIRPTLAQVELPADLTLNCDATDVTPEKTGFPTLPVFNRHVPISASCSFSATYEDLLETICTGHRKVLRNWYLINWCEGGSTQYVQTIDLRDTAGPIINCPETQTISLTEAGCSGTIDLPVAFLDEKCAHPAGIFARWLDLNGHPDTLVGLLSDFPGNNHALPDTLGILGSAANFPVGVNHVRYTVTDNCGNSSTCSFIVNVWDATPPIAACAPLQTVLLAADSKASIPATLLNSGSTADNCNTLAFRAKRTAPSACQPGSTFSETIDFCCADAGDTIGVTLRVYDINVPAGPVSNVYGEGHFSECSVQIAVVDTLTPSCSAPPDSVVNCADFDPTLAGYGLPITSCGADSVSVAVDYSQFDALCAKGTLLRTFSTYSNGVAGGQCVQHIQVNYLQDYFIHFPDDAIVTACDGTNNFGEPQLDGLDCEKMEVTYSDEIFSVVPDACYKIERSWRIINRCTYDTLQPLVLIPNPNPNAVSNHPDNLPGPVVSAPNASGAWEPTTVKINPTDPQPTDFSTFWSTDANGYQYKQFIKVIDSQAPAISCPASPQTLFDSSANDAFLWNNAYWANPFSNGSDLCEATTPLSISASDACSGAALTIDYQLFLDLDGDGVQETVVQSANLPGTNNVQFGNASNPNFSGGTPRAFDERPVPLGQQYRFAIDRVKEGNNLVAYVRWDTQDMPVNSINATLDGEAPQLPLGVHRIKWIVTDACGNEKTCSYTFNCIGLSPDCQPPGVTIAGKIETEIAAGVNNVAVALNNADPGLNQADTTGITGAYLFADNLAIGSVFNVVPKRTDNPANGLSTFDLVLMSKHILGISPLNSPYKIIAADINHSNSVTSFDVVEMRKLLLGIYSAFPANTSWRFVPKEFGFPDPTNPFASSFPEIISVSDLQPNGLLTYDFIGIKIGDLNNSAFPGAAAPADDRNGATLWFDLDNRTVQAGETFALTFQPSELPIGYQFTLEHPGLTLLRLIPQSEDMGDDNFAVFDHAVTTSWNGEQAPVFQAVFQAETSGQLNDMLYLSDRITQAEAYLENEKGTVRQKVALRFGNGTTKGPVLLQNTPNPFSDKTLIECYFPEKTTATLSVFDLNGRQVWTKDGLFDVGSRQFSLDRATLGACGVFYYELKTPVAHLVRKMVLLEH